MSKATYPSARPQPRVIFATGLALVMLAGRQLGSVVHTCAGYVAVADDDIIDLFDNQPEAIAAVQSTITY